ncbi:MAG: pilus assembly protein [Pseudomonadota bacterium]
MSGLFSKFEAFQRDQRGVVAIIFGFSIVFLAGVAGLAVDTSRQMLVSQKTGDLLDATAMMAAKLLDAEELNDSQIKERAEAYFNAQANDFAMQKKVTYSNFKTTPNRSQHQVDVTVDVRMPTTLGKVVSIDEMAFKRTSSVVYKSRKLEIVLVLDVTGSMCEPCAKIESLRAAAKSMIDTLYEGRPTKGSVRVALVPYAASVNAGGTFGAVTGGSSGGPCVVERTGFQQTTDASPGFGSYLRAGNTDINSRFTCPIDTVKPLTDLRQNDSRNAFKQSIDNLQTNGYTAGHIGLAWGWYTVSPNWGTVFSGDAKPRDYDNEDNIKAVVMMTDGMFNAAYTGDNKNSESPSATDSSAHQALALCSAMRAQGIQLYTVSYQAPTEAKSLLETCAADPNNAYEAEDTGDLVMSFRDIVGKLQMMRLTK